MLWGFKRFSVCVSVCFIIYSYLDTILKLEKTLNQLREEDFVRHEDIEFLENLFEDPGFLTLCDINDQVAHSQSFDQPEGSATDAIHDVSS